MREELSGFFARCEPSLSSIRSPTAQPTKSFLFLTNFLPTHPHHSFLHFGMLLQSIILISYAYQPKLHGTSFELLMFRSICDAGLALRFILEPRIAYNICGAQECNYPDIPNAEDLDYSGQSSHMRSTVSALLLS